MKALIHKSNKIFSLLCLNEVIPTSRVTEIIIYIERLL